MLFQLCKVYLLCGLVLCNCIYSIWSENVATSKSLKKADTLKLTTLTGFTVTAPPLLVTNGSSSNKDSLSKRNVKIGDLESSATAKSYEPPPEFYRGPGSTTTQPSYNKQGSATAGFISKPVALPDLTGGHTGSNPSLVNNLSHEYNKWQQSRNGGVMAYGSGHSGIQDRISVGHFGGHSNVHGNAVGNGGNSNSIGHGSVHTGFAYEAHPYAGYPAHNPAAHYHNAGHYAAYYGGSGGVSGSAESIPFDVYGTKGSYAGHGGEYSYTFPIEGHEVIAHKGPLDNLSPKALLAKSFLIPLASAAVLGITAALVSNPLLLQLGTVSGVAPGVIGKRRRRDLRDRKQKSNNNKQNNLQRAYPR